MQSTKQQQILGYFIEEAREHLDTIERGLLNLQATMADQESVNELFRAAHSIKGGAAMLGFSSIQKAGHHLEDCFKILKDHPVKIDQKLEALFLRGFDTLKDLLEGLQGPYGLREEEAEQAVKAAEPTFLQLETYLNRLISGGQPAATPVAPTDSPIPSVVNSQASVVAQTVPLLKQMLQLFKQGDSVSGRQQLVGLCDRLMQVSYAQSWQQLVKTAQTAITNPNNAYSILAPQVIRDLKQANDLLAVGRADEIVVNRGLQQLSGLVKPMPTAQTLVRETAHAKPQQVTIALDPKLAAKTLLGSFNKEQLVELADLILRAIQ